MKRKPTTHTRNISMYMYHIYKITVELVMMLVTVKMVMMTVMMVGLW